MKTLLDFYKRAESIGRLPHGSGLCFEQSLRYDLFEIAVPGTEDENGAPDHQSLTSLFWPTKKELAALRRQNKDTAFWDVDEDPNDYDRNRSKFSDLRKNIILFGCAMRGEL